MDASESIYELTAVSGITLYAPASVSAKQVPLALSTPAGRNTLSKTLCFVRWVISLSNAEGFVRCFTPLLLLGFSSLFLAYPPLPLPVHTPNLCNKAFQPLQNLLKISIKKETESFLFLFKTNIYFSSNLLALSLTCFSIRVRCFEGRLYLE